MAHPQETNFSDLPAGQSNLWFVDVSAVWTPKGADRAAKQIRKIIVHHHDGRPHDLTEKSKAHPTIPEKYIGWMTSGELSGTQYPYNYDLPLVAEFSPDGKKRVVYVCGSPDTMHWHTGAGQNEIGVGISLVGSTRGPDEYPAGGKFTGTGVPKAEFTDMVGLPSENQRAILPVLVRWLQAQYRIAHPHVQGHFMWGKDSCPGYDTERWILDHQETYRKKGVGYCYPVPLKKDQSGKAQFLQAPDKEKSRAWDYLKNTLKGRAGFFPFGRRSFWHNGVHLFPEGGKGTPVHCVRDGWVVAARFNKNVKVKNSGGTEIDYGSANFVLIQHEDPGVRDNRDKRTYSDTVYAKKNGVEYWLPAPVSPLYYSLYMHLEPLDDNIAWVKRLKDKDYEEAKKKDGPNYKKTQDKPEDVHTFNEIAIPVYTGEIIGKVGTHDPFAARPANLAVKHSDIFDEKNRAVLHFEMFSGHNLIERLDPDKKIFKDWTIDDTDDDAFSAAAATKLDKVPGLSTLASALTDKIKTMEDGDPRHQDPSLWSDVLDDNTLEALSKIIAHHVSEWRADWKSVIDGWFREWGMTKGKPDNAQKSAAEHAVNVAKGFAIKWSWPNFSYRRPELNEKPYFYHPIRFLNWLNGLERTIDFPDLKYNTLETTAYDISARKVRVTKAADAGATELYIDSASARGVADAVTAVSEKWQRAIIDIELLKGSRFRLASSEKIYTISATSKEKDGRRITFAPGLESEVKKNDTIRFGLYGWSWKSKSAWDRNFH